MKKPINVINLSIDNGSTSDFQGETLDAGTIIGISIFKSGINNPGMVNVALDVNGTALLPLHSIDNYRNRDAAYNSGFIPLNVLGGRKFNVTIQADEAFTADTKFQAVFYYAPEEILS